MENKNLTLENGENTVPKTKKDYELERELYAMMTENIPIRPNRYDLWLEEDAIDNDISRMERELREKLEREFYGEVFCEDSSEIEYDLSDYEENDEFKLDR
jgi:hypothetical protein